MTDEPMAQFITADGWEKHDFMDGVKSGDPLPDTFEYLGKQFTLMGKSRNFSGVTLLRGGRVEIENRWDDGMPVYAEIK